MPGSDAIDAAVARLPRSAREILDARGVIGEGPTMLPAGHLARQLPMHGEVHLGGVAAPTWAPAGSINAFAASVVAVIVIGVWCAVESGGRACTGVPGLSAAGAQRDSGRREDGAIRERNVRAQGAFAPSSCRPGMCVSRAVRFRKRW